MDNTAYRHSISIGSGNANCNNVTNSHNNTFNVKNIVTDETREIMQWLSPLNPKGRHHDVRTDRVDGVGNWLLETNEFREWRSSEDGADNAVLFCYGDPGVGKTYLSSLVIDNLCDESGAKDIAIAMFYCDFRDQNEQTATNIIGAILKQLVFRRGMLEHVQEAFQKAQEEVGGRSLRLPDMMQMLKRAVITLPQMFICIDALDECLPQHLLELLISLKDILLESRKTRIFFTGRPQVRAEIMRQFTVSVTIPISPKIHDIERYLEKKLEMDSESDAMSDSLRADILRIIPQRISGIFLLVSLAIGAILGGVTVLERKRKLDAMTKGNHLGDVYGTTLERIKAQKGSKSKLGMDALMWVSNSERPLRASELCHALGVKIGSTDLDVENVPTIRTLIGCSLGLITIEASSSIVRLVHFTLQEYLSNNPSMFQSPHSMISEVCLTYLNFRCVWKLSPTLRFDPPTVPLVEYASCYWGEHIRMEKTEGVSPLALKLLIGFERHISSQLFLRHYFDNGPWRDRRYSIDSPDNFTGLHGAAVLGIVGMVAALFAMKEWDINATDVLGRTALAWAAIRGHEEVIRTLLQRKDINPNTVDTQYNRTPLLWAVGRGYEGIVRLLLEREDTNPNIPDTENGQTPLLAAVMGEHEEAVGLLLQRKDLNPNTPDTGYGRTPLWWAAERGNKRIIRLLLEREDIDPNIPDPKYGQTPLLAAVICRHEGAVGLLLQQKDLNPNTPDTGYGRTPLWWAAECGNKRMIRLLLEREDIDPNIPHTKYDQTPLLAAVMGEHEGAVGLLLQRKDLNPNIPDTGYSGTPLWWVSGCGYEGIVRLLLEREDTNPNIPDPKYGQTPLLAAAICRHEGTVRLLLQRKDLNPNIPDTGYSGTPLWWASGCGYEGIVRLLLEREDTNPNIPDTKYGQTPLLTAAMCGHEGIIKLLLERKDLSPSISDLRGKTAPGLAMSRGIASVVQLLSNHKPSFPTPINTKSADNMRQKTLPQATILNSNNKRTISPDDEGTLKKRPKASLT